MKSKKLLFILIPVFVLVLLGASFLYRLLGDAYQADSISTQPAADAGSEEAMIAPDVTITDGDGNPVNLQDYFGKPIILNFWASWCGPCQSEMPDLEAAYQEYGDEIHFLLVNLTDGSRETMDSAREYIAQAGYTFPIYFDTTLEATMIYGASSIPITYFIDAEGHMIARHIGALTWDLLQRGMELIR